MGDLRTVLPAKFFIGMLSPDPRLFEECARLVRDQYGRVDFESEVMPWNMTDYYADEMGQGLLRKFVFLNELMDPAVLPDVKRFTVGIESRFSVPSAAGPRRRINIDPGYVTEAKVVLATTKDYSHRIYIGKNVYAEVTLRYSSREGGFTPLDHTYSDYRDNPYKNLFNEGRRLLRLALRAGDERKKGADSVSASGKPQGAD